MGKRLPLGTAIGAALLALTACGGGSGGTPTVAPPGNAAKLSLAAQVGQKAFFDKNLSGGKNMACSGCHDPQYAYGPPNSLSVQLGSDPAQSGARAVPSLRYRESTPAYDDHAANPDGVTLASAGGGFMWDGRAASMAEQVALPLLNPLEMNNASKADVVQAVQNGSYADLFEQAFGADVFADTDTAFADLGTAIQAFETEDLSFHPYSSKYDLNIYNKIGGTLTAAEMRGLVVFHSSAVGNCSACHYAGVNFAGNQGLMTDFTYQALGAPRNDKSIPGNPDPIPANDDPAYYDMGLCGPYRSDHTPAELGTPDPYCGQFKVPVLRNVATRGAFFHNGVFHSLVQVLHFYNTRDTHPEYWYPASGGSGTAQDNPSWALQPTYVPGATVARFNDLPADEQGSVDEEVPLGTGEGGDNTLGGGTQARAAGSAPAMTEQQMSDLICFLNTLSDGYQVPETAPTSGTCVN
ncbi:cytochrome-c peroxidase [Solimonas terrae]|uniref:Cytochrome-c peroxidase n=1 Tax=Solimonas terrae TaxID=1396819 RepID=A0A6M2BV58_9GAMM|nr:cytochrome c peroxidase [Solimonas terrae]NGY05889.1 cytochrome-c peroxidase [Solimonas terrae]